MRSLLISVFSLSVLLQNCSSTSSEESTKQSSKQGEIKMKTDSVHVNQVLAQARIEPEEKIAKLASPVAGIVLKIHKNENDQVQAQEVLVELDHEIELVKRAQAQSKFATQQAKLKIYDSEAEEFKLKVKNKEKELSRLVNLLKNGSETQQRIDDVETELQVLQASVKKSEANSEMAKAEFMEIRNEVELTNRQLDQRYLKAPASGQLISMNAVAGASVDTQSYFAEFVPKGKTIARAEVDELFATKIKTGQRVIIRSVGSNMELTTGVVYYAAPTLSKKSLFSDKAGDQEDRRVREVKIELAQEDKLLINSRVECVIKIK